MNLLADLADCGNVFGEKEADQLPLQRPYDCLIELVPHAKLPVGRIYALLNAIRVQNWYPLPLIPELIEQLCQAKIFTKSVLRGAYNFVQVRTGDKWKTAFRTCCCITLNTK